MKKLIKIILKIFGYKIEKINLLAQNVPVEANKFEKKIIYKSKKYSITDYKALYSVTQSIKHIYTNKIDGDIVECGVWRGGNIILIKEMIKYYKLKKNIFAFDTFEGMTAPSRNDINYQNILAKEIMKNTKKLNKSDNIWCYSNLSDVKNNILKNCKDHKNIKFIKGDVKKTLKIKKNLPKKISLLRLDTDFY